MEYISLIAVLIALAVGCLCGILQNVVKHKKSKDINIAKDNISSLSFFDSLISAECLLPAGNVAIIEKRCDENLNALMDNTFGDYERA